MMMLHIPGVRVPDPTGTYRWEVHDRIARAIADTIELGHWCDTLAWDALRTDDQRLAAHRARYGNKPRPQRRPPQTEQLFDH